MVEEALVSQLREMEEQTEDELNRLQFQLEKEIKDLHIEWDRKEEKLRENMKKKKDGLSRDLIEEFSEIKKKTFEKRKRDIDDMEKRANSRIGEASSFLIDQIMRQGW